MRVVPDPDKGVSPGKTEAVAIFRKISGMPPTAYLRRT
jgi:hypothetical protein